MVAAIEVEAPTWEVRPLSDLPGRSPKDGATKSGLTSALRALEAAQCLLVPVSAGKTLQQLASQVHSLASQVSVAGTRKYHTTRTPDGVWVWWTPREQAGLQEVRLGNK